jgi:cupin fold WbuC family metalloprotein
MSLFGMNRVDQALLASLACQAARSPRLRHAHPLHALAARVQRMLIALQPGTYVRPHWHPPMPGIDRGEFLLVIQGEVGLLLFDGHGRVVWTERMGRAQHLCGIELAGATYHTVVALAPNTILLEVKEGGYEASHDKAFLDMFPAENTPQARQLVAHWQRQCAPAR